jgi:hypothetical protein
MLMTAIAFIPPLAILRLQAEKVLKLVSNVIHHPTIKVFVLKMKINDRMGVEVGFQHAALPRKSDAIQ